MLATIHDPAASPAVGAGFAAGQPCLAGSSSPSSSFAVVICDLRGMEQAQHRLGKGTVQLGGGLGGCPASRCRRCGHVLYRQENQPGNKVRV